MQPSQGERLPERTELECTCASTPPTMPEYRVQHLPECELSRAAKMLGITAPDLPDLHSTDRELTKHLEKARKAWDEYGDPEDYGRVSALEELQAALTTTAKEGSGDG